MRSCSTITWCGRPAELNASRASLRAVLNPVSDVAKLCESARAKPAHSAMFKRIVCTCKHGMQVGRVVESFALNVTAPLPVLDEEVLVFGAPVGANVSQAWAATMLQIYLLSDWSGARSVTLDLQNVTLWNARGGWPEAAPLAARAPAVAARRPWVMNQHGDPAYLQNFRDYYADKRAGTLPPEAVAAAVVTVVAGARCAFDTRSPPRL